MKNTRIHALIFANIILISLILPLMGCVPPDPDLDIIEAPLAKTPPVRLLSLREGSKKWKSGKIIYHYNRDFDNAKLKANLKKEMITREKHSRSFYLCIHFLDNMNNEWSLIVGADPVSLKSNKWAYSTGQHLVSEVTVMQVGSPVKLQYGENIKDTEKFIENVVNFLDKYDRKEPGKW